MRFIGEPFDQQGIMIGWWWTASSNSEELFRVMRTYSGHFSKRKKQIGSAEKTAKLKPEEFGVDTLKARFRTAIFETEYF